MVHVSINNNNNNNNNEEYEDEKPSAKTFAIIV
jgi:hypothetical protein